MKKSKNKDIIQNNQKRGADAPLFEAKKTPERKCIGCNQTFERDQLLRILKEHNTGKIIINPNNKTFGRSAYLCHNKECLKIALKKKRLQRQLRTPIDENILEAITKLFQ